MFGVLTGAKPGELSKETRAAVLAANLKVLREGLAELPAVYVDMTQVQRNHLRLALCEAIGAMDRFEGELGQLVALLAARAQAARAVA